MATLTAQILVGNPHPNHDGINPSHYLFLSENSRPAWILVNQNIFPRRRINQPKIIWIPTTENMFEDALLMIAIHISKDQKLIEHIKNFNTNIEINKVEMYEDLEEAHRNQLYQECRMMTNLPKVIISIFKGSSIEGQLSSLKHYKIDVEICCVSYSRLYSGWTNDTTIQGSLE